MYVLLGGASCVFCKHVRPFAEEQDAVHVPQQELACLDSDEDERMDADMLAAALAWEAYHDR